MGFFSQAHTECRSTKRHASDSSTSRGQGALFILNTVYYGIGQQMLTNGDIV